MTRRVSPFDLADPHNKHDIVVQGEEYSLDCLTCRVSLCNVEIGDNFGPLQGTVNDHVAGTYTGQPLDACTECATPVSVVDGTVHHVIGELVTGYRAAFPINAEQDASHAPVIEPATER